MVKISEEQYGNWLVCDSNPEGNEEIISVLNEDRDLSAIELDLDLSDVRTDYVFKEMTDYSKERMELDVNKPYWTAAWKVTV